MERAEAHDRGQGVGAGAHVLHDGKQRDRGYDDVIVERVLVPGWIQMSGRC